MVGHRGGKRMTVKLNPSGFTIYGTPQDFLKAAQAYFDWCDRTPLQEEHLFHHKGAILRSDANKARPYTVKGFCLHANMKERTFNELPKRGPEWEDAHEMVAMAIYNQKFELAAAGLLNSVMITRDLGLAEKTELGGISNAPPVSFNIVPVPTGNFIPLEEPTK
jgi:hypothetical protein